MEVGFKKLWRFMRKMLTVENVGNQKKKALLGSDTIWLKRIGVRVSGLDIVPKDDQKNAKEAEEMTADGTCHQGIYPMRMVGHFLPLFFPVRKHHLVPFDDHFRHPSSFITGPVALGLFCVSSVAFIVHYHALQLNLKSSNISINIYKNSTMHQYNQP